MKTNKIAVGGRKSVNPEDVIILKANVNYTIIYFKNGQKCIVATPLKSLEVRFEGHNFYRVHKSFMVNLAYVKNYIQTNNKVEMIDNQKALVSRRKAIGLKKYLFPNLI